MFSFKTPLIALCGLILTLLASSCSDPDDIGLNLRPTSDIPFVGTTDTFDIQTYTTKEDSLVMYATYKNALESPTLFLGSLVDANVGTSYAGFAAQVRVGNSITSTTFGGATTPDSIILSFDYKSHVGDTSLRHYISVYELTEDLSLDSVYYSGRNYLRSRWPIGHVDNFVPNYKDSATVNGVNLAPQLRIRLYNSFGKKIMTEANLNGFSSTSFKTFMKGIVLVDSVENGGCMMTLISNSTLNKMTFYYPINSTPSSYSFAIDGSCVRSSFFNHNYRADYLDTITDTDIAVQSMAGLKTKCRIVDLEKLYANGKVAIGSAKLLFYTKPGTVDLQFAQHANLLLLGSDSLGKNTTFIDALETSSGYFGGAFDLSTTSYSFNIARYLQQTLTKVVDKGGKDYGFYLIPGGSTSNAQRTVLQGGTAVKLIVTYTKVNP